jgi:hypothetical protein
METPTSRNFKWERQVCTPFNIILAALMASLKKLCHTYPHNDCDLFDICWSLIFLNMASANFLFQTVILKKDLTGKLDYGYPTRPMPSCCSSLHSFLVHGRYDHDFPFAVAFNVLYQSSICCEINFTSCFILSQRLWKVFFYYDACKFDTCSDYSFLGKVSLDRVDDFLRNVSV